MDIFIGGNKIWYFMFDYLVFGIVQCGLYELVYLIYKEFYFYNDFQRKVVVIILILQMRKIKISEDFINIFKFV